MEAWRLVYLDGRFFPDSVLEWWDWTVGGGDGGQLEVGWVMLEQIF